MKSRPLQQRLRCGERGWSQSTQDTQPNLFILQRGTWNPQRLIWLVKGWLMHDICYLCLILYPQQTLITNHCFSPILSCKSQNASNTMFLQPLRRLVRTDVWDGRHFPTLDLPMAIKQSLQYLFQWKHDSKQSDESTSQTSSLLLSSLRWANIKPR